MVIEIELFSKGYQKNATMRFYIECNGRYIAMRTY